jgi:hypothetical protein
MNYDLSQLVRSTWQPLWNSVGLGATAKVDPSKLKFVYSDILTDVTGKVPIGQRFIGIKGSIILSLQQLNPTLIGLVAPWLASGEMQPAVNTDMYSFAQVLQLHLATAGPTDYTNDFFFRKAVPISMPAIAKDGTKEDVLDIEFAIYPDRSTLTAGVQKYVVFGQQPT